MRDIIDVDHTTPTTTFNETRQAVIWKRERVV